MTLAEIIALVLVIAFLAYWVSKLADYEYYIDEDW